MPKEYIDKAAAQHAVLHNEGQAAVAAIEAIQPEDVAPVRRGKWIKATLSGAEGYLVCSSCMNCYILPHFVVNSSGKRKLRWCPECGSENDADNGELVRCSECKWHSTCVNTPDDWFCADGKRKDNAE